MITTILKSDDSICYFCFTFHTLIRHKMRVVSSTPRPLLSSSFKDYNKYPVSLIIINFVDVFLFCREIMDSPWTSSPAGDPLWGNPEGRCLQFWHNLTGDHVQRRSLLHQGRRLDARRYVQDDVSRTRAVPMAQLPYSYESNTNSIVFYEATQ